MVSSNTPLTVVGLLSLQHRFWLSSTLDRSFTHSPTPVFEHGSKCQLQENVPQDLFSHFLIFFHVGCIVCFTTNQNFLCLSLNELTSLYMTIEDLVLYQRATARTCGTWKQHQFAGASSSFGTELSEKLSNFSIKAEEGIRLVVCEINYQLIFFQSFLLIFIFVQSLIISYFILMFLS